MRVINMPHLSKNLLNRKDSIEGYFYNDSGVYISNNQTFTSNKITASPGDVFACSRFVNQSQSNGIFIRLHAFDSNDRWLAMVAKTATVSGISVISSACPANTAYVRYCGGNNLSANPETNSQVELGNTVTPYEPFGTVDKFYGDIVVPLVPAEYDCVEYIQTNGTQYIDTGFKQSGNLDIEVDYMFLEGSTYPQNIFNSQFPSLRFYFIRKQASVSTLNFGFLGNNIAANAGVADTNVRHTLNGHYHNADQWVKQDGVKIVENNYSLPTGVSTTNLFLFTDNQSYTGSMSGRIYHFSLKQDGDLILDLVPVKRKSDNVYGMYDLVTNTFFGNDGTGSFTGGPVVATPVNHYMLKEATS